jgi:hypothetical protein
MHDCFHLLKSGLVLILSASIAASLIATRIPKAPEIKP